MTNGWSGAGSSSSGTTALSVPMMMRWTVPSTSGTGARRGVSSRSNCDSTLPASAAMLPSSSPTLQSKDSIPPSLLPRNPISWNIGMPSTTVRCGEVGR